MAGEEQHEARPEPEDRAPGTADALPEGPGTPDGGDGRTVAETPWAYGPGSTSGAGAGEGAGAPGGGHGAPTVTASPWAAGGAIPPPPGQPPVIGSSTPGLPGPPVPLESNPAQAVLVGLLNLSCLGLGYVLLKHWRSAAVCWAATVILLVIALPADVDGVPPGALIGYGLFLLAAAADGARRGLRAPLVLGPAGPADAGSGRPSRLRFALPLAVVLLLVPVGGSVAYGAARDEAVEQSYLDRLAAADTLVKAVEGQSFGGAAENYRKALATYQELGTKHAGSRAGRLVPDRLAAYYRSVSVPYEQKKYCEAVEPLKHLRDLPTKVDRGLLTGLIGKADEPLAQSWYECGTSSIGKAGAERTAGDQLNALLTTFPQSPHATKVEAAVKDSIRTRAATLDGSSIDPCDTVTELRRVGTTVDLLPRDTYTALSRENGEAVEKGDFNCGVKQFKDKEYTDARTSMTEFVTTYPGSRRAAQARNISIAAEIAQEAPAAGAKLPPATAPGGSRMVMVVSNDGPGEVELLYTGPITGRVTLKSCGTCRTYPGSLAALNTQKVKACTGPSSKYPKATLLLPPGTYHFLQKRDSSNTSMAVNKASTTKIESGYSYTNCLYVTSGLGF
ncbi:hypothetical protein [Streptomyces sp. NPDC047434]|uniref:hypothetical protein n=1 Tax=Streptomyces sp. NPDC047434 TaxID=3155143 RepID=UPI0033D9F293